MNVRGTKGSEQWQHLSLKYKKWDQKKCCNHWERNETICQTNQTSISQWHLPAKVTPDIDFTDGPVVSCDNSVVENTFVGDCK